MMNLLAMLLDKKRILAVSKSDMLDQELKDEIAEDLPQDKSAGMTWPM